MIYDVENDDDDDHDDDDTNEHGDSGAYDGSGFDGAMMMIMTVSYTHLTLPTMYCV